MKKTISLARAADDIGSVLGAARILGRSLADMTLAHDPSAERGAIESLSSLLGWICERQRQLEGVLDGELHPSQLGTAFEVGADDDATDREVCVSWMESDDGCRLKSDTEADARARASSRRTKA